MNLVKLGEKAGMITKFMINPELVRPESAMLVVTGKCNSRCRTCNYWKLQFPELTTEQWKGIIDDLKSFGIKNFGFIGGEPLLRKDLFELAEYTDKKPTIVTNGTLLNDEKIKMLVDHFDTIQLSLDGIDPETYLDIRGINGWQWVVNNIKKIRALKGDNDGLSINFVLQKRNYEQLPQIVKFAEENKINLFVTYLAMDSFDEVFKTDYNKESRTNFDVSKVKEVLHEAYAHTDVIMTHQIYWDIVLDGRKEKCWGPYRNINVHTNGDVYPCTGPAKPVGNLTQKKMGQIWNEYATYRKELHNTNAPACAGCVACDRRENYSPMNMVKNLRYYIKRLT